MDSSGAQLSLANESSILDKLPPALRAAVATPSVNLEFPIHLSCGFGLRDASWRTRSTGRLQVRYETHNLAMRPQCWPLHYESHHSQHDMFLQWWYFSGGFNFTVLGWKSFQGASCLMPLSQTRHSNDVIIAKNKEITSSRYYSLPKLTKTISIRSLRHVNEFWGFSNITITNIRL